MFAFRPFSVSFLMRCVPKARCYTWWAKFPGRHTGACVPIKLGGLKDATGCFRYANYAEMTMHHCDWFKCDGALRMVLDLPGPERARLRGFLEDQHKRGELCFGWHEDTHAQLTCYVKDYERNHLHFIDVANGGYWAASQMLKQQVRSCSSQDDP